MKKVSVALLLLVLLPVTLSGCTQTTETSKTNVSAPAPDLNRHWRNRDLNWNPADFNRMRQDFNNLGFMNRIKQDLGLPSGATEEQVKSALGLPSDATPEQLRNAIMQKIGMPRRDLNE